MQKLGVGADGVATTPLSGQPDLLRGPSPEASQLLQMGVEGTYRRFIMLVANARHLPPARVNEIAQGRVWDGGTAHQLGLVDRFGNLGDAIAEAARRAHLEPADVQPVFLEKEPGWLARLFADAAGDGDDDEGDAHVAARDAFAGLARRPEAVIERVLHDTRQLLAGPAIQARCLECPAVAPLQRTQVADSLWTRLLSMVWQG
jgi:protease-4